MNPIEKDAIKILNHFYENNIENYIDAAKIAEIFSFSPQQVNDAVKYLESIGAMKLLKSIGTHPFKFHSAIITSRGRFLYHELNKAKAEKEGKKFLPDRIKNPIGSPYGFTPDNYESVTIQQTDRTTLYVVCGLQFKSEYYNTDKLISNLKDYFKKAVEEYNKNTREKIKLNFEKLEAGLGEHLFNLIAERIIGADIAVFDTSDLNPNVMIELGVGLTWGTRVLPIREKSSHLLPSDISGQTYVEYEDSGKNIKIENFENKLYTMIERAMGRKGR